MATQAKLSLPTAILINLNIMMGAGVFINTVELAKRTGLLSAFMYPLIGLLISPLIVAVAQLIKLHPSGGFYIFGKAEINPLVGFISTWSYFIAKLASASLMIHVSVSLITQIFPALLTLGSILIFDILILTIFIALNLLNMKTGSRIQFGFLAFKLLPIFFIILVGLVFFAPTQVATLPLFWEGIPSSLPFVLYAASGFEATCALSNNIEDSKKNGPRAIVISFCIMMALVFLFQFLFYVTLANQLAIQLNYLGAFPAFLNTIFPGNPLLVHKLQAFFHLAIASSALGGCYGILYSNNWNLYILAQDNKIWGSSFFIKLNKYSIPYVCIFIEWLFCCMYLLTSGGNQLILQPLAAFGTTLTYTISVIALFYAFQKNKPTTFLQYIPYAALASCALLLLACVKNFLSNGIFPLVCFITLLIAGLFVYRNNK